MLEDYMYFFVFLLANHSKIDANQAAQTQFSLYNLSPASPKHLLRHKTHASSRDPNPHASSVILLSTPSLYFKSHSSN